MDLNSDTAFSADENAYFASGGETEIKEVGDVAGGDGAVVVVPPKAGAAEPGADATKGADKAASTVPLAALHEERTRRKALDTENRNLQTQIAELRGKFSIIEKLNLPPGEQQEQPSGPPAAEDDIFGAVKHVTETLAQIQKREADQAAEKDAGDKAAAEQKVFVDKYTADAKTFTETTPDYRKAYDFLLKTRAAELQAIGYDTPQALHEALTADEFAIAQMAFAKEKSPAEMIYALAKQRGYTAVADEAGKGAGAEKLDTIERGKLANKSLSDIGGGGGDPDMTAEALIAMPAADFEAWCEKNPAKAKRIMGG